MKSQMAKMVYEFPLLLKNAVPSSTLGLPTLFMASTENRHQSSKWARTQHGFAYSLFGVHG